MEQKKRIYEGVCLCAGGGGWLAKPLSLSSSIQIHIKRYLSIHLSAIWLMRTYIEIWITYCICMYKCEQSRQELLITRYFRGQVTNSESPICKENIHIIFLLLYSLKLCTSNSAWYILTMVDYLILSKFPSVWLNGTRSRKCFWEITIFLERWCYFRLHTYSSLTDRVRWKYEKIRGLNRSLVEWGKR